MRLLRTGLCNAKVMQSMHMQAKNKTSSSSAVRATGFNRLCAACALHANVLRLIWWDENCGEVMEWKTDAVRGV